MIGFGSTRVTAPAAPSSGTLTVTRSGALDTEVSVEYQTMGGAASPNLNYTPVSGTFTWAAGDSSPRTITVPLLRAAESGFAVSVFVVLQNPSAGAKLADVALGEIVIPGAQGGDDDGGRAGALMLVLLCAVARAASRRRRPD